MNVEKFDWTEELHQTMVKSLVTSFGLDFLLLNDRKGGDVDTIHNVRNGIYATEAERQRYEGRGEYDSHHYHSHENYIATNREGKRAHQAGTLTDAYTGEVFASDDKKNLDHIISAKEIHDDPGRILAERDGAELANDASNLAFTHESLNKSKKADSMDAFICTLQKNREDTLRQIAELESQATLTEKEKKRLISLRKKADADTERMERADKYAREKYEATINQSYYLSSKFATAVASASLNSGFRMGTRQMLGLILAEIWFELRERIPHIIRQQRNSFSTGKCLSEITSALRACQERVQEKFSSFLIAFKDGVIGGILSGITTTLLNIFLTTERMIVRLIREMWNNLVQAFKVLVFNPEGLSPGQLAKAVTKLIAAGVAVAGGVMINEAMAQILIFPFGSELAAFCGALTTGILGLVMNYYLEYSEVMQRVWAFLDKFKDKFQRSLEYFQAVNAELDRYLVELTALEFSVDAAELNHFSLHLDSVNSEIERGLLLREEVRRRGIALPFESGNVASVRDWLNKR
ncbi:cobalamin adenosyltransferase [Salmonella enterica]|nr:cobalamin adenosyltransferase [Salmonella enterica]